MANLGNLKIKDTYQLVLQTDAAGNLQKLDGSTPNPFIVNGNLRYLDGSQANGYVLISDAAGNASWGPVSTGDIFISGGTIGDTTIGISCPIKMFIGKIPLSGVTVETCYNTT
jgi:hypothetical protein